MHRPGWQCRQGSRRDSGGVGVGSQSVPPGEGVRFGRVGLPAGGSVGGEAEGVGIKVAAGISVRIAVTGGCGEGDGTAAA